MLAPPVEHRYRVEPKVERFALDGQEILRLRLWDNGNGWACGASRKTFVFLNGLESHSLWASTLAEKLTEQGHRFVALDRRGSGINRRIGGKAADWLDDVAKVCESERRRNDDRRLYVIAQCFGARLAVATILRRPDLAEGLILLSPGLAMQIDLSLGGKILVGLGQLLGLPIRLSSPVPDDRYMTDDAYWLQYLAADPLRLRRVAATDLYAGHKILRSIQRWPVRPPTPPCLAVFARSDRIVDVEGTTRHLRRLFSDRLTVRIFDEADHLLLFGRAAGQTLDAVAETF